MRNLLVQRPPLRPSLAAEAALRPLLDELDRLRANGLAVRREIEGLAREAKDAAEKDKLAAATALRAGRSDPGDGNLKAIGVKRSAATRRAAQIGDAQGLVIRDVERLLEASGPGWGEEARGQARAARLAVQARLDELRDDFAKVADLEACARWFRSAGNAKPGPISMYVAGLTRDGHRAGNPYSLADVLGALAALAEGAPATPGAPEDVPLDDAEMEAEAVA